MSAVILRLSALLLILCAASGHAAFANVPGGGSTGANAITLLQASQGAGHHVMYDYLSLELP